MIDLPLSKSAKSEVRQKFPATFEDSGRVALFRSVAVLLETITAAAVVQTHGVAGLVVAASGLGGQLCMVSWLLVFAERVTLFVKRSMGG